ncbi:ammonium transporter Rh type A-like [Sycon ciliatum]|uniref:ammonium transporter Rh type A-like n=1 Tax=Sycon ciliatum TaxID=27933 RepID=UPI0031F66268
MAEDVPSVLEGKRFTVILLLSQAIMILLFGMFVDYAPGESKPLSNTSLNAPDAAQNTVETFYPMWMDVHGMMFIGFGFLMAFLARYGYSSIGLNFLVGSFVLQWATLVLGFFHMEGEYTTNIQLTITNMLTADFAAAAVMITFGAVLGKVSALQLLVIAFFEILIFATNEMIGVEHFKAVDIGGSMFVHTFGAYFGLALSRVLASKTREARHGGQETKEGAIYHSDLFAMIGTIILWIYWPSFNAALGSGDQRHRAVINTYYALAACATTTFAISSLFSKDGRFDMVHVQNATLAGGVAVGASADFLIEPWGAMFLGVFAAVLSVLGYTFLQPYLQKYWHIHDTCGVHNLHGMPGILGGLGGIVATATLSTSKYGNSLYQVYPAMAPEEANDAELLRLTSLGYTYETGDGRSSSTQSLYQLATLAVTICMALAGGTLTGYIVRLQFFQPVNDRNSTLFEDALHWEVNDMDLKEIVEIPMPAAGMEDGASSGSTEQLHQRAAATATVIARSGHSSPVNDQSV